MTSPLIDVSTLASRLHDPGWVLVDCRFELADPAAGRRAYLEAHIPGAVYAHLDEDLSGPPLTDHGRHPLPAPAAMTRLFGRLGIDASIRVVAYDASGGGIAARLWWMLRYMRHDRVALLDGGWPAWARSGGPVQSGEERNAPRLFVGAPRRDWLVVREEVPAAPRLLDARAPERYRGEVEPIDPVAGHIPGAVNLPYAANLDAQGRFLPPDEVRRQLREAQGGVAPEATVHYCGSGVSACLNLVAQAYAGMPLGRLYVGSWSEWSRDLGRGDGPP